MWGVVKNEIIASVSLLYFNAIAHPVLVWSLLCTCFCHNDPVEGTMSSALLNIDEKGVGVGFRACVECSVVFSMCVCFCFDVLCRDHLRPLCGHSAAILMMLFVAMLCQFALRISDATDLFEQ